MAIVRTEEGEMNSKEKLNIRKYRVIKVPACAYANLVEKEKKEDTKVKTKFVFIES